MMRTVGDGVALAGGLLAAAAATVPAYLVCRYIADHTSAEGLILYFYFAFWGGIVFLIVFVPIMFLVASGAAAFWHRSSRRRA